jgi:lysophospholipase L1-like esterase
METAQRLVRLALEECEVNHVMLVGLGRVDEAVTVPYKPDKSYINEDIARYDEVLQSLGGHSVTYIPIPAFINAETRPRTLADGLHPSPHGHELIARVVESILRNLPG